MAKTSSVFHMLNGIYSSGLAAYGQQLRLDVIANNLANTLTPGFRRDTMTFRQRFEEALEDKPDFDHYNAMVHRYGGAPFIEGTTFDREPGTLEATGRDTDFAILGDGFFRVREISTGNFFFTRAGNFMIDPDGRLTTADGKYLVLSPDGDAIDIEPEALRDIRVDQTGALYQGNTLIGQIGVVGVPDLSKLSKHGDTLFSGSAEEIEPRPESRVLQGHLEASSANPVEEIVDMIRAFRSVESNLQMIRYQDSTLERAVNDLGRLPR